MKVDVQSRKWVTSGLALLLALVCNVAWSQQVITGRVTDEAGQGIPGVNIIVENTTNGTTTDVEGRYSLSVEKDDAVLVFSFIGYATQRLPLGNQSAIDVRMVLDETTLQEVVFVGYGTQAKRDITGAITSVTAEKIEQRQPVDVFEAIQGLAPGVQINTDPRPGGEPSIRIRGTSTLEGGVEPLYVVDGVPVENINVINPNDIQSVEILKDASSAAIYGSRSANGVIIITTKRGVQGKPRIDVRYNTLFSTLAHKIEQATADDRRLYDRKRTASATIPDLPADSLNPSRNADNDLQEILTRTAIRHQADLSISGASDKLNYYASLGYLGDEGIIVNSWARLAGWRISEESFLNNVAFVNELKLRGSWGRLGNSEIGNYPYQYALESVSYNFNGTLVQGITEQDLVNTNIRWETTTVADIGIDFSLLNSKLFGSVDWYQKTTTDILRDLQIPEHVGLNAPTINDGILENTGWEFILGHRNKIGEFGYSINANLETYRNKLIKFGARELSGVNLREEGLPYNQFYVLINDGVYQNQAEIDNGPTPAYSSGSEPPKPGTLKFKDVSGPEGVPDGRIDLTHDRVPVDGVFPKFNYGANLAMDYKSIDLSVFIQGVHGRRTYVTGWGVAPFQQASAPPIWWRGAWDGEGTSNSIPHIFMDGYTPNSPVSTFWLGNSSYFRIKNVQLGYTVPAAWSKKVLMQTLRVYAAADNLYTRTKFFQGLDPERTASGSARAAIYPQATIYSFGVRAVF